MTERFDGGAAFPRRWEGESEEGWLATPGMSLRDWFAGIAMQAVLRMYGGTGTEQAKAAYQMADWMLREREKGGE